MTGIGHFNRTKSAFFYDLEHSDRAQNRSSALQLFSSVPPDTLSIFLRRTPVQSFVASLRPRLIPHFGPPLAL
jgi:hypothetical protein